LRAALVIAAAIACGAAGPSSPRFLLREQVWTAPGATLALDLTQAPPECLATRTPEIEIGRALFRSPVLLGGPAARLGLSCNACHSNGGANVRFLLPELTDRIGHADVTSEWASATRGDGRANPLPIPDLAGAANHAGFGQAREPSLDAFVRGVIVEEFQGAPPPSQAFDGLIAYLRALRLRACPADHHTPIDLASAANDVRRALHAAEAADTETAGLLIASAQDAMGRIVERLPAPAFARDRRRLERLALDLATARAAHDPRAALAALLPGWRARFEARIAAVARREDDTFFNTATLQAALAARD